jgi:hypothetical protein
MEMSFWIYQNVADYLHGYEYLYSQADGEWKNNGL